MKMRFYIFLILLIILGCKQKIPKDFKIVEYHKNGEIMTIEKELGDTLINGNSYKKSYVIYFKEDGKIDREGNYINFWAYGNHFFYDENSKINCIRNYHIWKNEEKELLLKLNWTDTSYYTNLKKEITYLNEVYRLNENFDTIGGNYVKIVLDKNRVKKGEAVIAKFSFVDDELDFDYANFLFQFPDDTSKVITGSTLSNDFEFKQIVNKTGLVSVAGFAFVHCYSINNSGDTIKSLRTAIFDKPYFIED